MGAAGRRSALWALVLLVSGSAGAVDPAFVLRPAGPPFATTEGGSQAAVELRLSGRPREDVTFRLRSTNPLEATVEPGLVTLAAAGEEPAVARVTVAGVQDDVDDDDVAYEIEAEPVSGDPAFLALGARRLRLVNLDDDVAGIRVTPAVVLVRPGGPPASFEARLTSRPQAGGVEAGLTSSQPDAGTVSPEGLSFSGVDWRAPAALRVTPSPQAGPEPFSWEVAAAPVWSQDERYAGVMPDRVRVVRVGSGPGFTVAPTHGLATTADGGAVSFQVALNQPPRGAVTLTLLSSIPEAGTVSPASLVFTPEDWQAVREVVVTGRDGRHTDRPLPYRVTVSSTAGGTPAPVELVNLPSAASKPTGEVVILAPSGGLAARKGQAAGFGVVLSRPPSSEVWVYLRSDRPELAAVEPPAVGFSPGDWSTPRPVTVRPLDVPAGGGRLQVVTGLTWSQDPGFRGLDPADVPVTVADPWRDGGFFTVPPCRLFNSRIEGNEPLRSGAVRVLDVYGRCGIPAQARALAANLIVLAPTGRGNLAVYAADGPPPTTSTVNFPPGINLANGGLFPLSADGRLALRPFVAGDGSLHVAVEVTGYFE